MTTAGLLLALVRRSPLTWAFHALGLAVAVAVLGAAFLLRAAAADRLDRDLAGVDLVVGANGSPLQLVASTLFQVDAPTGNIPAAVAASLSADPLVELAAPMSLGDSVRGTRIVGTVPAYLDLYGARIAGGRTWREPMEAVLGADAARSLGLAPGDMFAGEHGLAGGEAHDDHPYRVVGVLAPTGAVIDRLVVTDLASVWALHGDPVDGAAAHSHDHGHDHDHGAPAASPEDREVTAVLVRYRSPLGAVVLPPRIGADGRLQAASPAVEARRLTALLGAGADATAGLAAALLALSFLGFLIALAAAVSARRRELALLRALGAPPGRLMGLSLLEGALLGLVGGLAGVALARLVSFLIARAGPGGFSIALPGPGAIDAGLLAMALALGLLGAVVPGLLAARTDVVRTLGRS